MCMCAKFGPDRTTGDDVYTLGRIHTRTHARTHTLLYRFRYTVCVYMYMRNVGMVMRNIDRVRVPYR